MLSTQISTGGSQTKDSDSPLYFIVQLRTHTSVRSIHLLVMWQPSPQPPPLHVAYSLLDPDSPRVEVIIIVTGRLKKRKKEKKKT